MISSFSILPGVVCLGVFPRFGKNRILRAGSGSVPGKPPPWNGFLQVGGGLESRGGLSGCRDGNGACSQRGEGRLFIPARLRAGMRVLSVLCFHLSKKGLGRWQGVLGFGFPDLSLCPGEDRMRLGQGHSSKLDSAWRSPFTIFVCTKIGCGSAKAIRAGLDGAWRSPFTIFASRRKSTDSSYPL